MDEAEEAFKHTPERDREMSFPDSNVSLLWWNLSSELIFFLLYQFVTFTTFVESIHSKLIERSHISLKEGRDFLMWALLQFISGSIGKSNIECSIRNGTEIFHHYDNITNLI